MKMNGSKQHVVLALMFLVLSVAGYTSGSVLPSSSMLAAQQGQECDEEGASLTVDCNFCYCLNGQFSCSNKICATNSESKGPLETDNAPPQNSTNAYENSKGPLETDNEPPQNSTNAYEEYEEDPDYRECVEGTRWTMEYPEECNICECSFGQAICTSKPCLPECVHGTYWVEDCNTCECYEGESTCTDRKCLSATACKEGSRWTHDCNTCFCSNGITSCTKKICPDEGDVTSTQLPEITNTTECNGTFAGCGPRVMQGVRHALMMGGPRFRKIPSELNFCIYTINGQQEYFAYIAKCYKPGKLACAYCEDEAFPKYNPRTCKCHPKSRFRGSKG